MECASVEIIKEKSESQNIYEVFASPVWTEAISIDIISYPTNKYNLAQSGEIKF